MNQEPNLYARLGVPLDATPREIRRAYREAARRLHPDRNQGSEETELFLQIQEAYDIISDPQKRADYDATLPKDAHDSPPVAFRVIYSRESISIVREPQLFYVLIELEAPEDTGPDTTPPINSCLVIDCSTSMQGMLMDSVKTTAVEIVRSLHDHDTFGLVAFNDTAQTLAPGGIKLDRSALETAIQMLKAQGGTEIYKGLAAGYEEVKKSRRIGSISHLVLLTDGKTYGDEGKCLRLARQARDEGITFSTLGLGDRWNDDFLDQLATTTGGSCTYVAKPADISRFMKDKFYIMTKSFASQVTLSGELDPNVRLKSVFRLTPEASPLPREIPLLAGSLPKGETLSFLLEFAIKALDKNVTLLNLMEARLTLDIPTRLVPNFSFRFDIQTPVEKTSQKTDPPLEILHALSRLTLYRMQERVQEELRSGRVNDAASSMKYLATNLLSLGENDLAHTVMHEASMLEQNSKISEQGKKRIKYGTRSLVFSSPADMDDRLKNKHQDTESLWDDEGDG